jgi:hypothetical protein
MLVPFADKERDPALSDFIGGEELGHGLFQ